MSDNKNYAVLIDSENISSRYAESIFQIMSEYGDTPIRRIYGDFSNKKSIDSGWKDKCNDLSIKQIHHYNNIIGKNSCDFSLVIDAMDMLYKYPYLDGYVIVSSDSDFTELIQRLKESCKRVIGMGEAKTPKSIINACSEFKYLENYINEENPKSEVIKKDSDEILGKIKEIICNNNGTILVSLLKEKLLKIYPDFDEKNYGYNQMNKFLHSFHELTVEIKNRTICYVSYENKLASEKDEDHYVKKTIEIVKKCSKKGINLGELCQKLFELGIDYSTLGYSKFRKFIETIPSLKIDKCNVKYIG